MRRRSSTIDFSAASDRIFAILGLLESSHQGESKSDVSFVIFALVKKFFELSRLIQVLFDVIIKQVKCYELRKLNFSKLFQLYKNSKSHDLPVIIQRVFFIYLL